MGSRIFPLDFDIFCPFSSLIRPVINISLKGISFMKYMVIIIILATQKKIMSKPVTKVEVGWNNASLSVSFGQPRVAKVHKLDENHVSSTSSSCLRGPLISYFSLTCSSELPAKALPSSSNHIGIRCPHHSCLLMHQS